MVALVWDMPSHSMVVLPIKLPSRGRGTPRREAWVTVTVSAPSGVTEGSRVRLTSHARTWPVAGGSPRDSVAYGLLRSDFETGRTTPLVWDDLKV